MRYRLVLGVVGELLLRFSPAFVLPLLLAFRDSLWDEDWNFRADELELEATGVFLGSLAGSLALGFWLRRGLPSEPSFRRAEALAVAVMTWAGIGLVAAIPYVLFGLSPVDAYFESISGLTTTGATILTDFDAYPRAFFLWRAMTQWFGGLGVIALFVVVLPRLGIAGRQIFFAEASGAPSEAISSSVRRSARNLWLFYTGLTALQALLFMTVAGWDVYTSVVHSLTTLAAGGFSPNGSSIMGYANPAAEWIFVPFMFIAGASYPLLYKASLRKPAALLKDGEFLLYTTVTVLTVGVLATVLSSGGVTEPDIRDAAFQITSLISSAGFASVDYVADSARWTPGAKMILVVVMILGGCAGSAAGGAKEVRFLLVFKFLWRELTRVLHPRAILPLRYRGQAVSDDVMRAVFTLVLLYLFGYFVVAIPIILIEDHIELEEAFAAAIATLSNVGPAFGTAGPMGSYAGYTPFSKAYFTLTMLVGRLEIVSVLALLHPHIWRSLFLRGVHSSGSGEWR